MTHLSTHKTDSSGGLALQKEDFLRDTIQVLIQIWLMNKICNRKKSLLKIDTTWKMIQQLERYMGLYKNITDSSSYTRAQQNLTPQYVSKMFPFVFGGVFLYYRSIQRQLMWREEKVEKHAAKGQSNRRRINSCYKENHRLRSQHEFSVCEARRSPKNVLFKQEVSFLPIY